MPRLTFEEQLLQESGLFVFTKDHEQSDRELLDQDDSIFEQNASIADNSDLSIFTH